MKRPARSYGGRAGSVLAMQFQLVDVFTSTPYRGNSLTVFPDAGGLSSTQMAQITASCASSSPSFSIRLDRNIIGGHASSTSSKSSTSRGIR